MKCKGCGIKLQSSDPKMIGYTHKAGSGYCRRCFRLMQYDDLNISMKTGIDPDEVLRQVEEMDALILWVVDLFDFEASMIPGLNRHLVNKDIVMVGTKRDLLPVTLSNTKLSQFILSRMKEMGLYVNGIVVTGKGIKDSVEEVWKTIEHYANNRPIVVLGKANVGKSTLLNALMQGNALTQSRYPGTTLDFNKMEYKGYTLYDTPGLEGNHTMLMMVPEKDLKVVLPQKAVKPMVFQCYQNQTYSIGGLAQISVFTDHDVSVVFYVSNQLKIHRTKAENRDELWDKHRGELLVPTIEEGSFVVQKSSLKGENTDIVIDGLGWCCISGKVNGVEVRVPKGINVTYRKAMI